MILKFKNFKLNENPDTINIEKNNKIIKIKFFSKGAKAFAWKPELDKNGKYKYDKNGFPIRLDLWVGDWGKGHTSSCPFIKGINYFKLLHKGRLWYYSFDKHNKKFDIKIISFWDIDEISDEEMPFLIKDLKEKTGDDFSKWYIDVGLGNRVNKIVPVSKYMKVEINDKERKIKELKQKLHIADPIKKMKILKEIEKLKGKKNKSKGFGSEYYKEKLPKNMTQAEYKNKKTKYKFTESFDNFKKL